MTNACTRLKTFSGASVLLAFAATSGIAHAQDGAAPRHPEQACAVNLQLPGMMKDIVSSVLLQRANRPEAEVHEFLENAEKRYATGPELMRAAAHHFNIDAARMAADVESFRHINCSHDANDSAHAAEQGGEGEMDAAPALELSEFARNVAVHVILHELGHALVREFDQGMIVTSRETPGQ